ncbi:MAG: alginate lyase family protein [Bryobacteraceae bacterium]
MRHPAEIVFRLRQEIYNIALRIWAPRFRKTPDAPLAGLPDPETVTARLRGTEFAATVERLADEILAHRFPIFGGVIETGPVIDWRRDYPNHISSPLRYFRLVPYLDVTRVGDHKNVWELNRHQHLVLLAQAFRLTRRERYLREIEAQLESWWEQNPFQQGINWTSALEVAFRAHSWIWVHHLAGASLKLGTRLFESLYQHGLHLENNLSFYFSPNTHLLGEAVVLHALGTLFPAFPRSRRWVDLGGRVVKEQMRRQVRDDGSHFEQSTYYQVYALDMFLYHAMLEPPPEAYRRKLAAMGDFLEAMLGPDRSLPFLGDDDGGRWFHPYGTRDRFGRATLATCSTLLSPKEWRFDTADLHEQAAWWLGRTSGIGHGQTESHIFRDCGLAVWQSDSHQVIIDAGGFGPGRAGHSHSDALSLTVTANGHVILSDSGTYTYVGDPMLRDKFRGSAAHSAIRIDGHDQATSAGPFWWADAGKVEVRLISEACVDAQCSYSGFVHRRIVRFEAPGAILVLDEIIGPPGVFTVEQFWQVASAEARSHLHLAPDAIPCEAWRSTVLGERVSIPGVVVRRRAALPLRIAAAIDLTGESPISIRELPEGAAFSWSSGSAEVVLR